MFYHLPHVPVSPIPSIDSLPDLFPKESLESPTSMSEHPPPPPPPPSPPPSLVFESPLPISDVSSHAYDELPTRIIDVPTDIAPPVDPAGPFDSHAFRCSHRVTTLPSHLHDFHCFSALASLQEPQTFREAFSNPLWQQAMKEELDALYKTGTWDLVDLSFGKTTIGCKWVYKINTQSDGTVDHYKAHLVAKVLLRSMGLIMRRLLLLWLDSLMSGLLLPFLWLVNGHSFIWKSKMIFLMVNSQRKSI